MLSPGAKRSQRKLVRETKQILKKVHRNSPVPEPLLDPGQCPHTGERIDNGIQYDRNGKPLFMWWTCADCRGSFARPLSEKENVDLTNKLPYITFIQGV